MRPALAVVAAALALLSLFVLPAATMWSGWAGGAALGLTVALLATDRRIVRGRYR